MRLPLEWELRTASWRKSSYSNGDGGECVEVARGLAGALPVRDSKGPGKPVLVFPHRSWQAFLTTL
ncbi:DUF397 domain-containing protein [Streptomyces sp. 8K308]|uniref:DUF397 domain-containing protein n=1 Tax=Streptomyces sp. 8K308 TaxID=2530388 RepID=UPI001053E286|nr:DUF397 domain-containing protein [Streptomyces sp. 8K308]TDC12951.1 DUF397 domain-containing protein [Streptomyces sp. 8K308]